MLTKGGGRQRGAAFRYIHTLRKRRRRGTKKFLPPPSLGRARRESGGGGTKYAPPPPPPPPQRRRPSSSLFLLFSPSSSIVDSWPPLAVAKPAPAEGVRQRRKEGEEGRKIRERGRKWIKVGGIEASN